MEDFEVEICIIKWKKPFWKDYILYNSNVEAFLKNQNCRNLDNLSGFQRLAWSEGKDKQVLFRVFEGQGDYYSCLFNSEYMEIGLIINNGLSNRENDNETLCSLS